MKKQDKKFIDILPKFTNWETIQYSNGLNCPHCNCSGFYKELDMKEEPEIPALIGWCETPQGFMMVFECPHCFEKYRFHGNVLNRFDIDKFDFYVGGHYLHHVSNEEELKEKWNEYIKQN